jgi:hypothetical protein
LNEADAVVERLDQIRVVPGGARMLAVNVE